MILKRLVADNILKYRKLQLTDLPPRGQIAISGRNEAGKTAIGESICFALFGRTFSLPPEEIARVIRWGEFKGGVLLEFTGRDGADYVVARQIDNNGKHRARFQRAGERQPLAEGVEAVQRAVIGVLGFGYRSFVDSFYLAQREMEVPHAKSATVKALIGVDKLEAVAADIRGEIADTATAIAAIDENARSLHDEIAEVDLDRARLGRLESQRDTKLEEAAAVEGEIEKLTTSASAIGKAAQSFEESAGMFVATTLQTNYADWRERRERVGSGIAAVAKVTHSAGCESAGVAVGATDSAVSAFDNGFKQFDRVRDLARLYHSRLDHLLADDDPSPALDSPRDPGGDPVRDGLRDETGDVRETSFTLRRAAVSDDIEAVRKRRKLYLILGVVFVELAVLSWAGWAILLSVPESTVGGWLTAAIALSATARQLVLLFGAIATSAVTTLFGCLYVRATHRLRICRQQLSNIESAIRSAEDEMAIIEALEEASVPDALSALRGVRNDLLSSAAMAFEDGDGAVLVQPNALEGKLAEIRRHSGQALRSLEQTKARFSKQADNRRDDAAALREDAARIEIDIEVERERLEKVESLERQIAELRAKVDHHRHEITIRTVAGNLIDGACRRIYGRFHPELRRFVGKILPELTEERYQHLEIDDDLRVRVFCNEKNDFVGLAEISNGTHRQLMLCVRLALSQALIASSAKSMQFIFFDEPFAFFDEQRMARAIDVLGKISPQITQVFLAAQNFVDPTGFDMFIECGVGDDVLEVSGNGAPCTSVSEKTTEPAPESAS